jgi:hypothetical protein
MKLSISALVVAAFLCASVGATVTTSATQPPATIKPLPMGEQFTTQTTTPLVDGPLASKLEADRRKQEQADGWLLTRWKRLFGRP